MITIIDYGLGNLGSIYFMLKKIQAECEISSEIKTILNAKKIILPGVGAFDTAMRKINEMHLDDILKQKALIEKVPILGICLGMQLLTNNSEEGCLNGLSLINADTRQFKFADNTVKVPHMGWNTINIVNDSPLTKGMTEEQKFYFVHSYYVKCKNSKNIVAQTNYGITFDSIIQEENIFGVQFHPEKSHKYGMHLLKNFASI